MKSLRGYILRYWKSISFALAFLTCEAVCDLFQPTIMARMVDRGIARRDMHTVLSLMGLMFAVTAVGAIAAVGRNIISSMASTRFGADIRSALFRKIQSFSFASLDRFETGALVTRLTSDAGQVQLFFNGMMRIFAKAPIMAAGSIVMAILLNAKMSVVLVAVIPLILVVLVVNLRLGFPLFTRVQKALDSVNTVMQEYLAGVRVVKAFNRFDYERGRFEGANERLAAVTTRVMRVMAFFGPGIGLSLNIGIIAVLWFGGQRVQYGDVKVGEVIAFTNYMTQILFSLMMISMVITTFARARASAERMGEVLAEKESMPDAAHPRPLPAARSGIVFSHVYFSYGGESAAPVLSDIHFSVAAGETIGIIGSTGAGKSSLMNLVPRFYDTSSGSITVFGVDVMELVTAALRDTIAVVPQKTTLFTGTIGENIRWGRPSASPGEIERAAEIAQAREFIEGLPERYDTMLGQGGVNLSGGQKQRISIARALVRNPSILILDDCTSSVDVATEAKIRSGLAAYMRELTSFFVSQRITSVMRADRILVLENGTIAGLGTHAELVGSCEVYRDIFRSQIGSDGIPNA
jgi:ATP-binding cassette subfamily B protein